MSPRKAGSKNVVNEFLSSDPEAMRKYQEFRAKRGAEPLRPSSQEGVLPSVGGGSEGPKQEGPKQQGEQTRAEEPKKGPPPNFDPSKAALGLAIMATIPVNGLLIKMGKETYTQEEILNYATTITPFCEKYYWIFGVEVQFIAATAGMVWSAYTKPVKDPVKYEAWKTGKKKEETQDGATSGSTNPGSV